MKMRLMLAQAYLLMFGSGLLMLGLFAGADYLWRDGSFLFSALIVPGHSLLAVLAWGVLLALVVALWLLHFSCSSGIALVLDRLGFLIAMLCALAATLTWYLLFQADLHDLQTRSDLVLDRVEQQLDSTLDERLNTLQRMGERFEVLGQIPYEPVWRQEASSYLRDYPDLLFVAILDRELSPVRTSQRQHPANSALTALLGSTPVDGLWHRHPEKNNGHGRAFLGGQSNSHTLLVMPIQMNGRELLLVAGLDMVGKLRKAFGTKSTVLELRMSRSGQQVFAPPPSEDLIPVDSRSFQLAHDDLWQIETLSSRHRLSERSNRLASWLFPLILFIGFLLMISQRLARLALERNQALLGLTEKLRNSIKSQAELHSFNEQIMHHSMDLICAIDAQGRFIRVSDSAWTILGCRPEQLCGRSVIDFVLPEDHRRTREVGEQIRQGQPTSSFRNRYRHRDGQVVHLMWSAVWHAESNTQFCAGRDVTALVSQEQLVQQQQKVMGMISRVEPLERILDVLCMIVEHKCPATRAAVLVLGAEATVQSVRSAPHLPIDFRRALDEIALAAQGTVATVATHEQALHVEDLDTSAAWASYQGLAERYGLHASWSVPLISKEGDVLGTFAVYAADSREPGAEQREMLVACAQLAALAVEREGDRQQLSENEQRYRSLFSFNPDAVFAFDMDGTFTSINDATHQLTGRTEQQLLGSSFGSFVHQDDLQRVLLNFQRACQGQSQRYELRIWNVAGELLELDVTNLPILIDNQVVGVFGIAKDLRPYKRARRALEDQLVFTQAITDSLQEGLIATDTAGRISFANPAALKLLGCEDSNGFTRLQDWTQLDPASWIDTADGRQQGIFEQPVNDQPLHLAYRVMPLHPQLNDAGWVITLRDTTLEREAGRALRERDQFFSLSIELFCMVNLAGHFVQINPAFLSVFGYQLEELLGRPYADLIKPADHPLVAEAIKRLTAGELVEDLSVRVARADGSERILTISASLGEDQIIYVAARDVTQQRAADIELQQQQSMLEIAGNLAQIGGWIANISTGEVILSDEICAVHKLPPGSAFSLRHVADFYAPEWHQELRAKLQRCIEHGTPYQLRCEALTVNGERIWVQLMGKALRDAKGRITHVQGALQNISDMVKAEEKLLRLDATMQIILESITDAFWAVDRDWRFVYVNPRAEMTLQQRRDQLLGRNVWDCFPEARNTVIWQEYHAAVELGQSRHFEIFYEPLQLWLEISAFPSEEGLSVYFRDITQRKHNEQQLRDTLAELERSNRELQDFAFIASHDLQEPLRKVQAFGERLEKSAGTLDATSRDYLQRMRQAAERMQSLIQDLLLYSRVSSQGEALKPVDLDRVLDAVLEDMETSIASAAATVERAPLPVVMGDARQLGQVLQNLLSNALKFQQSGVSPLIQVYARDEVNGDWTLCVADNGIGFEEKYLDRIFDPFQRLNGRQHYSGTGIGLAIVRKIVERHGAVVTARSQPGQGTTFEITFRRQKSLPGRQLATAKSITDAREEVKL